MRDVAVRSGHGRKSTHLEKRKERRRKEKKAGIDIARKWYEVLTYLLMTSADQHEKKKTTKKTIQYEFVKHIPFCSLNVTDDSSSFL